MPTKPSTRKRPTVAHPAKFSTGLLPIFADLLDGCTLILDPFAGTGRVHSLVDHGPFETVGIEIEAEWAEMHEQTLVGNALDLPFEDGHFDGVCTSPTYGNRLADHHDAKDGSIRHSYRHTLGRPLSPDNSGQMQWGPRYRDFHESAWAEVHRVLKPGGRFVLNLKDHIRKKELTPVTGWHVTYLSQSLGFQLLNVLGMAAPTLRQGVNAQARAGNAEIIFLFERN